MKIKRLPAGFVVPAQPVKALKPPSGADWVHEIKHDGCRMIVRRDGPVAAATQMTGPAQAGVVYIGYSFFDGVTEYYYWFPAVMVVDPLTRAVDYVPV